MKIKLNKTTQQYVPYFNKKRWLHSQTFLQQVQQHFASKSVPGQPVPGN